MADKISASSRAPGTCGELLQGFIADTIPFHVTFPINLFATVELEIRAGSGINVTGLPPYASKMTAALTHAANILNLQNSTIHATHHTQLQTGKGMGSSTADIIAAATALAKAVSKPLSYEQLAHIATTIESSDGTMYPGIAAVNHKNGELIRAFDWYPEFNVAIIVPDEMLDTAAVQFAGKDTLSNQFDELLHTLSTATDNHDEAAVAKVALESATLNQNFVPNPYFKLLQPIFSDLGALGLNVAHTGTMLGVLFESGELGHKKCQAALPKIASIIGNTCTVETTTLVGERDW